MDVFVDAFFRIDTDEDEVIRIKDLEAFVRKNKLDGEMITKWRDLFDKNNDGVITLTEFCDTLGLRLAQIRMQRIESQRASVPRGLHPSIKVIHTNMSMTDQILVSNEVYRMANKGGLKPKEMARQIKTFVDQRYGRMWHVVITSSSLWSSYSQIPSTSFFFKLDDYHYLIWRSPE